MDSYSAYPSRSVLYCLPLLVIVLLVWTTPPSSAQQVVVTGLNFPIGMTELPDGSLLVAESGGAGKISRHYADGTREDFAAGLFDVRDVYYFTDGSGKGAWIHSGVPGSTHSTQRLTDGVAAAQTLSDKLSLFSTDGQLITAADIPAPTSVSPGPDLNRLYPATFGGDVYTVGLRGSPSVILATSNQAIEDVAYWLGPPGNFFVVQRQVGHVSEVSLDGRFTPFATVTNLNGGIAALDDGSVLVTAGGMFDFSGRVVRLHQDGSQEDFATGLFYPRGLLVRSDGRVLVTTYSGPSTGEVLEVGSIPVATDRSPIADQTLTVSEPHPNPASGLLRFHVRAGTTSRIQATVFDVLGRQVAASYDGIVTGSVVVQVDATPLPAGLYLLRVTASQGSATQRFTVAR